MKSLTLPRVWCFFLFVFSVEEGLRKSEESKKKSTFKIVLIYIFIFTEYYNIDIKKKSSHSLLSLLSPSPISFPHLPSLRLKKHRKSSSQKTIKTLSPHLLIPLLTHHTRSTKPSINKTCKTKTL